MISFMLLAIVNYKSVIYKKKFNYKIVISLYIYYKKHLKFSFCKGLNFGNLPQNWGKMANYLRVRCLLEFQCN